MPGPDIVQNNSLKFGTSGLRGLVTELMGTAARAYALAFLQHADAIAAPDAPREVLIGHDLRASSPQIAQDCVAAARRAGFRPLLAGALPTPALALSSMRRGIPAIMITGSHIPDDRNGLKFYLANGEITKDDETAIGTRLDMTDVDEMGRDAQEMTLAISEYRDRYTGFFPAGTLSGLSVGVYQQSSVARDLLVEVLEALGADVTPLGRADRFVPVDTEAHRTEDLVRIAQWAKTGKYHAIVSTDGDADRPLVADGEGNVLRGDVLALLTARHLDLDALVTPVTSTSSIETSGIARIVVRTRVGSPFVIAGMEKLLKEGETGVAGFEANGGFLLGSAVERDGRTLAALPTRDALLPIVAILAEAKATAMPISELAGQATPLCAAAHRLKDIPAQASGPFLERLATDNAFRDAFLAPVGKARTIDLIDGVRILLEGGSTIHYRASGNAPELRCYVEAASKGAAERLLGWGLDRAHDEVAV